jgi:hypothetical protein
MFKFRYLLIVFLFTFSKQSFAQTKSFFEGPYVGGAIGYTTYKTRFNDPVNGPTPHDWYLVFDGGVFKKTDNLDGKNINGTISTGYNWIFDKNYLFGLEAEASSGKKIVHSSTKPGFATSEWGADINYIANLRLKAGTIHEDKNLFYLTAGPAMAKAEYSAGFTRGDYPISINKTVYGLSYGVGVERQIGLQARRCGQSVVDHADIAEGNAAQLAGVGQHKAVCHTPRDKDLRRADHSAERALHD